MIDFETFLCVFYEKNNRIAEKGPFGALGVAARRLHGMTLLQKYISSFVVEILMYKMGYCLLVRRGPLRAKRAPLYHSNLIQSYYIYFGFATKEKSDDGKKDWIWRPLKNTLLLWSKKNGFSNIGIFEKLQYFFDVF